MEYSRKIALTVFVLLLFGGAFIYFQKQERPLGLGSPTKVAEQTSRNGENNTDFPLSVPRGFSISIFAQNVPGARVLAFDQDGNLWVSRTAQGVISMIELKDGKAGSVKDVFSGLDRPHGLAFDPADPDTLYFAENDKISKVRIGQGEPQKIADLPDDGGHFTRTLIFSGNGRLFVSVGSSCNACDEKDNRRASIFTLDREGRNFRKIAGGLRNSVFMTMEPRTGQLWATEMGRDYLGDNLPPDEINIIKDSKNYGWPYCYGNRVHDPDFDPSGLRGQFCQQTEPAHIEVPAHSAPLGLAFVSLNWPAEYQNDLLVAYHGSWNRSKPTGYKVVRYKLDENGNNLGGEDFITGWLVDGNIYGRPVDIVFDKDGAMFISDDKAGVIYRLEPIGG